VSGAGARRSSGVAGEQAVPSPGSAKLPETEVLEKPRRRTFTAEYKQRILREYDRAKASGDSGAVGALLRAEGLYSSHLVEWRRQREAGELAGLAPAKRGRKSRKRKDPVAKENERLRRENERLQEELRKANTVIDVQKKLSTLLGIQLPTEEDES